MSEQLYGVCIHNGKMVGVRQNMQDKQDEYTLCCECARFDSGNCEIASKVHDLCIELGIIAPVWACPSFSVKMGESTNVYFDCNKCKAQSICTDAFKVNDRCDMYPKFKKEEG